MSAPLAPEVRDLLALQLVPGVGPRLTAALLERFGDAGRVLRASRDQLAGEKKLTEDARDDFGRP